MKRVLITGGTRGIGFKIAEKLSNSGYKVFITGRDGYQAKSIAKLLDPTSNKVSGVELDLTSMASIQKMSNFSKEYMIDTLIHNAGMLSRDTLDSVSETRFEKMMMVNTLGPMLLTKYMLPHMLTSTVKQGEGSVLFFCPPYAIDKKTSLLTPYMQTKLAQTTFMRSIANMVKDTNIRVAGFWTNYPIYTDALTHRQIGKKENCMDPMIIAEFVKLLLEDDPKKISGQVLIDSNYLPSNGVDPLNFALGNEIKGLDQLFMENLKK